MAFKDKFVNYQPIIVNDELILRQVNVEKDLEDYYKIYSNPNVFKYFGGGDTVSSIDTVKIILQNQIKEFEKARVYSWTISDSKDNALGRILLSNFEYNNKIANIGYFIGEDSWGKGIISACIKPVIEFGFSHLGLERIYTRVHIDNTASWKALEKNGFIREGLSRHCFNVPSGLSDCYFYAKLNTD